MLSFSTFHEVEAATTPEPVPTEVIVVVDEVGESTIYSPKESTEALSKTETSEEAIMELESMAHFAPVCISARSEKGFVQVTNNCWFDLRVKVIFAFAGDSACKLVKAGTRTNIAPHRGRIDGIKVC